MKGRNVRKLLTTINISFIVAQCLRGLAHCYNYLTETRAAQRKVVQCVKPKIDHYFGEQNRVWVEAWVIQTLKYKKPRHVKVLAVLFGARNRNRTGMTLRSRDFKSLA
jgi:hypothetical protein